MRLFLSSQDLGNYAKTAVKMAGDNKKAAFIKNAQDDKPPEERNFSTPQKKRIFLDAGFDYFEEVDLRDYFGQPGKLLNKLSNFGSIWCAGGNTFILRRAMKASGLDEILKERLKNGDVLYGGWSAGACIAAPSLHGIQYGDRPKPDVVPKEYPIKKTIWEGLDLVEFMIVPHVKSDWFGMEADRSINYLKKHKIAYKPLEDGQVIVIDGDKEEFLQ